MNGIKRTMDLGLAAWALRGALVAGKLTPFGVLLLVPTALTLVRDGAALVRDGSEYLRHRRQLRRFIRGVR
jgi:hypothetical protein